jgi:predicted glutamine amidotransferase
VCRWLAYSGPPMVIEDLLFKPQNSLIRQSLAASRSIVPTNGDGFGLGWYGSGPRPGLFRDTLPAWNDSNLRSLSEQIASDMFFAHVRASTGTSTSRENCHPFRHGSLLFMHNGAIGGFRQIRRAIEQLIPAALYGDRLGTTDSEAFFLLALGNGLADDIAGALQRTVAQVLSVMAAAGVAEPFHMTAAISDGRTLWALRYSDDCCSPTLYYATGAAVGVSGGDLTFVPGSGATLVLSEPLDDREAGWTAIPEGCLLSARDGAVEIAEFAV